MTSESGRDAIGSIVSQERPATANQRSPWGWRISVGAIVLLSGLLYLPSIHGSMIWDDTFLIKGSGLDGATTVAQCFKSWFLWNYYRPLTEASFVVEHRIWGDNTFGYHLTNLLLHVLTTAIIIPLLLKAFRSQRVALAGALLFAVQPVQVSTVAWIGGRTDSLCTLFIALFSLALITAAECEGAKRHAMMAVSFALFAAAAASKEQALVLMPLVPLALYIFGGATRNPDSEERQVRSAKDVHWEAALWTVPFALLAPIQLRAWKVFGDPVHPHWNASFQLPAIGRTIDYYVMALITPSPGLMHTWTLGLISKSGWISVVIGYMLAAFAAVTFVRWMRSAPVAAWFLAGAVLLLIPVSNVFPLATQVVAPYRAGTAGFYVAALVGWAVVRLLDSTGVASSWTNRKTWIGLPAGIYVVWLGCLTLWDTRIWRDQLTASVAVETYDPSSTFGTMEVAATYLDLGQLEPAVTRLDRIMELVRGKQFTTVKSDSAIWTKYGGYPIDWVGELYGRAGQLEVDRNNRADALSLLNKGALLSPSNELVRAGLANYAFTANDLAGGAQELRTLLRYRPKLTDDRMLLGQVLLKMKQWNEAAAEFTTCIMQRPSNKDLYIFAAYARIQDNNRPAARDLLTMGLTRRVLDAARVQEWLSSIGEPRLLD